MTWLVLAFHPDPPGRDFDVLALDGASLRHVDPRAEALAPHVDPRWTVTEAFVLEADEGAAPWQRHLASELAAALAEDVMGRAEEVELAALPATVPPTPRAEGGDVTVARDFLAWLDDVTEDGGFVSNPKVAASLADHIGAGDARLRIARARAKPADVDALFEWVRARYGAELPRAYRAFLEEVGALRVEAVDAHGKTPSRDVLLPAKAVSQMLERRSWLTEDRDDGPYVPFFRFGDDEYFAFDLATAELAVVGAYFTGEIEPVAASFGEWVDRYREAHLTPLLEGGEVRPRAFGDGASVARWWGLRTER